MIVGDRVRMKRDAIPTVQGDMYYRKGDVGTITKKGNGYAYVNFNGVEGQHVHDDGKWLVPRPDCEVIK